MLLARSQPPIPSPSPTSLTPEVKVAQWCLTLCDPMNYTVHGILQARILEWVAIHFSRGPSKPRDRTHISHIAGDSLPAEPQGKPRNHLCMHLSMNYSLFCEWFQFRFFLLLYVFYCMSMSALTYPFCHQWTLRLLPSWGNCEPHCYEHSPLLGHICAHFSREHTQDTGLELLNVGGVGIFCLMVHHFW